MNPTEVLRALRSHSPHNAGGAPGGAQRPWYSIRNLASDGSEAEIFIYDFIGFDPFFGGGMQVERLGSLETKDATRTRIKWYISLALLSTLKLAKLTGVRD